MFKLVGPIQIFCGISGIAAGIVYLLFPEIIGSFEGKGLFGFGPALDMILAGVIFLTMGVAIYRLINIGNKKGS